MTKNSSANWCGADTAKEIKRLSKSKQHGLVWEYKSEAIIEQCRRKQPLLVEVKEKAIQSDPSKPENWLIEGDNYHALAALSTTHQGKVDVIYIDPPYNTRKKIEWKFNDNYVDEKDSYRHSKWLSMMAGRLQLAKRMLSDSGVIFISIDDNEQAQLKLLCDAIFGEKNFIQNFMWLHGKGKKDKWSRTLQQYMLCYAKDKKQVAPWSATSKASYPLTNSDEDSRGAWFSGSISFSEQRSNQMHANFYTIQSPSNIQWTRQWQVSEDKMASLLQERKIYWGAAPEYKNVPRIKIFPGSASEQIPPNMIEVSSTREAQKELDAMFAGKRVFEYPKPVALMQYVFRLASQKDSLILDFFSGSGTTGHAVLALNQEDGGSRQFILATNNEDNNRNGLKIATDICYPRIKKAIQGYHRGSKKIKGLGGNLKYLRTTFASNKDSSETKTI